MTLQQYVIQYRFGLRDSWKSFASHPEAMRASDFVAMCIGILTAQCAQREMTKDTRDFEIECRDVHTGNVIFNAIYKGSQP